MLTIDEIRSRIEPIARKYHLNAVYLFGSYARNEATEESDVDLLIDRDNSSLCSLFDMGGLYNDLQEVLDVEVDIVTTKILEQKSTKQRNPLLIENLYAERIQIYNRSDNN